MKKTTSFVPTHTLHEGERYNKFGLSELTTLIIDGAYKIGNFGRDDRNCREMYYQMLNNFFSSLETDVRTIRKKQKIFQQLIADEKLLNFLLKTKYPTLASSRNHNDPASSSQNDVVAVGIVEYLDTLTSLIAKKPAYGVFRKVLSKIRQEALWLKQMDKLAYNSRNYSKYSLKAKLMFSAVNQSGKEKSCSISSEDYVLTMMSEKGEVPVYNRSNGLIDIKMKYKKLSITYFRFKEETEMLQQETWKSLIRKVVEKIGLNTLWSLKHDEEMSVEVDMVINANTGKTTATVSLGNKAPQKLQYVPSKHPTDGYDCWKWVYLKERYKSGDKKALPKYLGLINELKGEHLFVGSRRFIYSCRDEFEVLFSELDQLVMMAAVANFFRHTKGKWVIPIVLPKESMTTKITGGINPLFLHKGNGECVSNDAVFTKQKNGFLITGANTGGKTGYTNMIAINQMLAQAGFPVFADVAKLSIKDKIICHYVESEDIGVNLSRYQSELHRLREIVEQMTQYSMILFDEPFSGTSVESGTHQAHEVLKVLSKVGCVFIMNTHLHQLVDMVGSNGTSSVQKIHFLLPNREKPLPTDYKVQPGGIKISYGEAIALIEKVDYKTMMRELSKRKVIVK